MADFQFDVFLSHNSADKPAVEALALRLHDAGCRPWLDKWNLVPGEPWQEGLEDALDACRTVAVFLGPTGISPWENEEMRSALEERVHDKSRRVIPVLLPDALEPRDRPLPRFLRRLTWVDFRDNLLYASGLAQGRTLTVLTMRADFYPRAAAYAELADRLADHQVLISPLVADELREAIEAPAQRAELAFDPGLVDTILDDVAGQPGALPLLQHALFELWVRRQGRQLTFEAYREIGGVNGAIARRAEAEYGHLPADQQAVARRILLRLVQPGEGTVDTRRRARLSELMPDPETTSAVEDVVHTLADARLLTTGRDPASGEELVDVAHEALVQGWPRLRRWLDEDREALQTHRRLTERAQEWAQLGQDGGSLLRGVQLAEVADWAGWHGAEMNVLEREFLEASLAEQERQAQILTEQRRKEEQLAAEQRSAGRLRRMAIGLAIVFVFALAAAVFAVIQRSDALDAQLTAVAGKSTAEAESAKALRAEGTAQVAREAAIKAEQTAVANANIAATAQAEQLAAEKRARLKSRAGELAAYSRLDSKLQVPLAIEALSLTEEVRLPALPAAQQALIDALASQKDVPGFDPRTGSGGTSAVPVSFSPDGQWLYGVSRHSGIRRWEICPHRATALCSSDDEATFGEDVAALNLDQVGGSVYFSADGQWVAATSDDDSKVRIRPLDPADLAADPVEFDIGSQADTIIGLSPDARWLATMAPRGTTARLWDLTVAAPETNSVSLPDYSGEITAVAFSHNSQWLVTARIDRSLQLWDLTQKKREPDVTLDSNAEVRAMAFSPDDRWLAAGPALFDLSSGTPGTPIMLPGHAQRVWTVAFSPENRWLVTSGNSDGSPERVSTLLWTLTADGPANEPINLSHRNYVVDQPSFSVSGAAFSPDGRYLATSIQNPGTILLWSIRVGDQITVGCQVAERDFTPEAWETYFPGEDFRPTCQR